MEASPLVTKKPDVTKPGLTVFKLVGITAFMFAAGLLLSTYGMITLALEAERLAPSSATVVLPAFLAVAGVAQLVCPLAGYLSDRTVTRLGKRRPYILGGGCALVLALIVQRSCDSAVVYAAAFLVAMVAINFMYTASTCLVPDLVPADQTGLANGAATLAQVGGSFAGFLFYFVVDDLDALYDLYLTSVVVTTITTVVASRPLDAAAAAPPFSWSQLLDCYYVSPTDPNTADFAIVWISRTLYYTGGSAQAFLQYFIRDRVRPSATPFLDFLVPHDDPARATCAVALAGYVAGIFAALPAGSLSDSVGRKPVVVFACVLMALSVLGIGVSTTPAQLLAFGLLGGLGNGAYQAVDLALAVDTLPDPAQSAQYMGIWGVGAFIGITVGPLIGGPLLFGFGKLGTAKRQHQDYDKDYGNEDYYPNANSIYGYLALYFYSALCLLASAAILVRYVTKAR